MTHICIALAAASMYVSGCIAAFVTGARLSTIEKLAAGAIGFAAAYGYFHLLLRLEMGVAGMFAADITGTLIVVALLLKVERKRRRKQDGNKSDRAGNNDQFFKD